MTFQFAQKIITPLLMLPSLSFASMTFTDSVAFEAAISNSSTTYMFNDTAGDFTFFDYGDFTASLTNPVSGASPRNTGSSLQIQTWNHLSSLDFVLDSATSYLAFDWTNSDETGDILELTIAGSNYTFSGKSSGFFGIILDSAVTTFSFGDTEGGGRALKYATIDNLQYESISNVPVPAAVWLMASGLLGLMGVAKRKR